MLRVAWVLVTWAIWLKGSFIASAKRQVGEVDADEQRRLFHARTPVFNAWSCQVVTTRKICQFALTICSCSKINMLWIFVFFPHFFPFFFLLKLYMLRVKLYTPSSVMSKYVYKSHFHVFLRRCTGVWRLAVSWNLASVTSNVSFSAELSQVFRHATAEGGGGSLQSPGKVYCTCTWMWVSVCLGNKGPLAAEHKGRRTWRLKAVSPAGQRSLSCTQVIVLHSVTKECFSIRKAYYKTKKKCSRQRHWGNGRRRKELTACCTTEELLRLRSKPMQFFRIERYIVNNNHSHMVINDNIMISQYTRIWSIEIVQTSQGPFWSDVDFFYDYICNVHLV